MIAQKPIKNQKTSTTSSEKPPFGAHEALPTRAKVFECAGADAPKTVPQRKNPPAEAVAEDC